MDAVVKKVLDRARAIEAHIINKFPRKGGEPRAKKERKVRNPELEASGLMNKLGHTLVEVGRSYTCIICGASAGPTVQDWRKVGPCLGYLVVREGQAVYLNCQTEEGQDEGMGSTQGEGPGPPPGSPSVEHIVGGRRVNSMDDSQAQDFFPEEGEAQEYDGDKDETFLEQPNPLNPDDVQGASSSSQGGGETVEGGQGERGLDHLFGARRGASILEVLGPGKAREARTKSAAILRIETTTHFFRINQTPTTCISDICFLF